MSTAEDFPNRPTHDDFWLLSEIILDSEVASDTVPVEDMIGVMIDPESLLYMATGRASQALRNQRVVNGGMLVALYIDAFLLGAKYQARKTQS